MLCFTIIFALFSFCFGDGKSDLNAMLLKSAGVYKTESKRKGLDKTVLVTGTNFGFVNHLLNFKCFADRLGLKFLVISFDKETHNYITENTTMNSYMMIKNTTIGITNNSTKFRDPHFNLITNLKVEIVHDILSLGYDVIFADTDVAIIKDPVPYLIFDNVDYVHSVNTLCMV